MQVRTKNPIFGKVFLGGLTLAGVLGLAGAAPSLRADDCQERTVRADHELHEAAAKHGWDSPEAAKARERLNAARSWCWEHGHRWWDEDAKAWRSEHWDEHDHDHPPQR
jgi:hypothetical protein